MENIITDIYWDNTRMFIEYTAKKPIGLTLMRGKAEYPTEEQKIADGKIQAVINIAIAEGGRELLPGGFYRFVKHEFDYEIEDEVAVELPADNKLLIKAVEKSRIYRYGGKKYAYAVTFDVKETENGNCIRMFTNFMRKNNHPKRRRPFFECKKVSKKIKKAIGLTARKIGGGFYYIFSIFAPKKKNRILFMSENRFAISENLDAINVRLKERNLDEKYKISYSFRNIFDRKYSLFSSLAVIWKIAMSDYIFIDDYTPIFTLFKLRKSTVLVQTWHAGVGFKTVGYARFGIAGSPHPYHSCHRKYTYGLVGCEDLKDIYSEVWGIPKSALIASGMPRLDHFLDEDIMRSEQERLLEKYPQLRDKKVILFAPTYRGVGQKTAYYDFEQLDFPKLYEFCKENNAVFVFKMHHFIKDAVPIADEERDLLIEITDEKINSLYYVSDVLITDYSSCFYDYSLLKKPILFYLYDQELYTATRGVQRPIEDVAPGKICNTFDDMLKALKEEDFETEKLDTFYIDKAGEHKKMASDIVIDEIILGN